jgi:alkanesulfonate monooxygenase SsuD/methylene tetrahydromethanopterin reductase-like flavin-dependent oxidoreductase (luciferase family)
VAFDEVHDLGILTTYRNPPVGNNEFSDFFQDFRRHAQITSEKIMMEAARRVKVGAQQIVVLDAAARQAIHVLLNAIREKLNELTLPEAKRESLFNKLNSFAAEIDRNRTRPEAFYAFAIEAARTAREVNDELKPLQQTIDRVFDWLDKAKKLWDVLPR